MFRTQLVTCALLLALQAQGHTLITPALGGGTARADVQRPSTAAPCGKIDPTTALDTSTAVPATNGQFQVTATDFNA